MSNIRRIYFEKRMSTPRDSSEPCKIIKFDFNSRNFRDTYDLLLRRMVDALNDYLTDAEYARALECFVGENFVDEELFFENIENDYNFHSWLLHDYEFSEPQKIFPMIFKERYSSELSEKQNLLLDAIGKSFNGYYEAIEIAESGEITLRQMPTSDIIRIIDKELSEELVKWDILFARIVRFESHYFVNDAMSIFPPRYNDIIQNVLRKEHEHFNEAESGMSVNEMLKDYAYLFIQFNYMINEELERMPSLLNEDNEELIESVIQYSVSDFYAVSKKLSEARGITLVNRWHNKTTLRIVEYKWHDDDGKYLGRIKLKEEALFFYCNSRERGEKFCVLADSLCGDAAAYVKTETAEIPAQTMQDFPDALNSQNSDDAAMLADFFSEYYRDWPETKQSTLGDLTPLEAARKPELIDMLRQSLHELENLDLRAQKRGYPKMLDLEELKAKLNLPDE